MPLRPFAVERVCDNDFATMTSGMHQVPETNTSVALPLMALVLGRLTANFTGFGSIDNQQSRDAFMESVKTNALVSSILFCDVKHH